MTKLGWCLTAILLILFTLAVAIYLGLGPALACQFPGAGPLQAGLSARVLMSSEVERCYLAYMPASHTPDEPIPVVFSLHGFAGTPQGLRKMTGWEEIAELEDFLVILPHGSSFPLRWNTDPSANIDRIDDVQFIRDMLADLSEIATVDATRVYVTGFSNGATMADQIACELADRVAAVGVVGGKGEDPPETCSPSRPVPVIGFFGTDDPLGKIERYPLWFLRLIDVDPSVNEQELVPLQTWIDGWVARNGCRPKPEAIPRIGDATGVRYTDCTEDASIWVYRIEGGGHTWPGGSNLAALGKTSQNLNASATMWQFFESHPLGSEP